MNLRPYIDLIERVALPSAFDLAAFTLVVAETYDAAPLKDKAAEASWVALNKSTTETLFKKIKASGFDVTFTPNDPYAKYSDDPVEMCKYMLYDLTVFHKLEVYSGHSEHPVFTEEQNVMFRTVHDFFAHGVLRKVFVEELKRVVRALRITELPPVEQAGKLLSAVKLKSAGSMFTARGEMNAASTHMRLAPRAAQGALFTEVVGQVCYQQVTGDFGVQKVCLLPGFDYLKIGVCLPGSAQQKRYDEIKSMLARGDTEIKTSISKLGSVSRDKLVRTDHH